MAGDVVLENFYICLSFVPGDNEVLSIRHLRKALNVMGYSKRQPTKTLITTASFVVVVIVIAVLYFFSIRQTHFDPLYVKLRSRCETCQIAKTLAIEDFKKGNYQVVAWGLISSESPTIKMAEILERDYKIKTVFGGCIGDDAVECYDTQMRRLLVTKLGDFYKNAYEQAKKNSP